MRNVSLQTREDCLHILERTVSAIISSGELVERAGTIANLVAQARAILKDKEDMELLQRVEGLERVTGANISITEAKATESEYC